MKKKANSVPESFLSALRQGFVSSLKSPATLGLMVAPFAAAGVRKYETHRDAQRALANKATAYREMMDLHPHLQRRDQAEIGRIYNSLHNASPNMAHDPLVAGAWVDNILENRHPGMNSHQALLNAVKDLTGIQKNVSDIERNRVGPGAAADKTERWITDYTKSLDQGITNGIDAHFAREAGKLDKKIVEFDRKENNDRANQVRSNLEARAAEFTALADQRYEDIERREKALEARERGKTSSARTPLGEMLRALKV